MERLSFNGKRIVVGVALVIALLSVANHYLNLGFFAQFSGKIVVASFTVLGVAILYFGPTPSGVQEYRDKKRTQIK